MLQELLWTEKYRPNKVADTILPQDIKLTLQNFVDNKSVPNLLLTGPCGTGKTTAAKAMLDELNLHYMMINGSLNGGIDNIRYDVSSYASSMSIMGGRKYVIFDEADGLTAASQPALRSFIEDFSKTCGFIFTANFPQKIIEPLKSRCSIIEFNFKNKDKEILCMLFLKRLCFILDSEKTKYDKKVLANLIIKFYPDWRRIINECQRYSAGGSIDSGILSDFKKVSIENLVKFLKEKNFTETRKWLAENNDIDSVSFFRDFYDDAYDLFKSSFVPQLVILIADYQYKAAFAADSEINLAAFLVEIMVNAEWKE